MDGLRLLQALAVEEQLVPSFPDWMSGGCGINRVQELVTLKFMSLYLVELLCTRDHMRF